MSARNENPLIAGVLSAPVLESAEAAPDGEVAGNVRLCEVLEIRYDLFPDRKAWAVIARRTKSLHPSAILLGTIRLERDGGALPDSFGGRRMPFWEKIIDAFSRAVSRNKLLEKYEKKIVALEKKVSDVSGLLDKMKQFISNRELGEALAEFVKSLEPKTMKERLTEKQKVVKEQTQQKSMHTQEHGTSRKHNISTEL
jgi:hypothetical protein